jgi:hypothetical protein
VSSFLRIVVVDVVVVDNGGSKKLPSGGLVVERVDVDAQLACRSAVPVERRLSLKAMVVMVLLLLSQQRHLAHYEAATLTPSSCLCLTSRSVVYLKEQVVVAGTTKTASSIWHGNQTSETRLHTAFVYFLLLCLESQDVVTSTDPFNVGYWGS